MIQVINRVLVVLATIGLIVFMSLSSFIFGTKEASTDVTKMERKIEVFKSKVIEAEDKNYVLEKEKIIANSLTLGPSDTLYVEF